MRGSSPRKVREGCAADRLGTGSGNPAPASLVSNLPCSGSPLHLRQRPPRHHRSAIFGHRIPGFLNDLSEGRAARADEACGGPGSRKQTSARHRSSPPSARHQEPHQLKNGLLSQWRGYAGEGGGYCVVFDEDALDGLVDAERRISPGLTILKKDIVYVGDENARRRRRTWIS